MSFFGACLSTEPPPKYSMITRMRDAKQASNSKFAFGPNNIFIAFGGILGYQLLRCGML